MFLSLITSSESGVTSTIVDNADDLKGLEYSRALETEADNSGMRLMIDNSIDPAGMLRLMEMLQKDTGPDEPNSFMSTHPIFAERIKNIKDQIAQLPADPISNSALKKTFHDIYEKGEW
jgi:predicted Zn-dependent protease